MPKVIFELTMPNRNSRNGAWSGDCKKYTVIRDLPKGQLEKMNPSYYYDFGDGWGASVEVRRAGREKATGRFNSYGWMIDSILKHNEIRKDWDVCLTK